jgi:hypothetical protein
MQTIYDANRGIIGDNPDLIFAGVILTIPCEPSADSPIDCSVLPYVSTLASLIGTSDGQILDIRSEVELADGVIPGAISIPFARGAFDVFDDLLARALRCLSHRPLLSGYDEQQTLS